MNAGKSAPSSAWETGSRKHKRQAVFAIASRSCLRTKAGAFQLKRVFHPESPGDEWGFRLEPHLDSLFLTFRPVNIGQVLMRSIEVVNYNRIEVAEKFDNIIIFAMPTH
jgi:hypothetical protein